MNKIHKIDLFLSGLASFHNVDFLSIKDNLCNASGCLLYVGEDVSNVTSLDHGHLSTRAAIIIVDRISKLFSFK